MTLDEAKTLGRIVQTADNGCEVCVGNLVDALNDAFDGFEWAVEKNPDEWDDDSFEPYYANIVTAREKPHK